MCFDVNLSFPRPYLPSCSDVHQTKILWRLVIALALLSFALVLIYPLGGFYLSNFLFVFYAWIAFKPFWTVPTSFVFIENIFCVSVIALLNFTLSCFQLISHITKNSTKENHSNQTNHSHQKDISAKYFVSLWELPKWQRNTAITLSVLCLLMYFFICFFSISLFYSMRERRRNTMGMWEALPILNRNVSRYDAYESLNVHAPPIGSYAISPMTQQGNADTRSRSSLPPSYTVEAYRNSLNFPGKGYRLGS